MEGVLNADGSSMPWAPVDLGMELSLDVTEDGSVLEAALNELGSLSQQLEVPLELTAPDGGWGDLDAATAIVSAI